MTETLTDSGAVKLLAGANVSTDLTAADYTKFINFAEGHIALATKIDWVNRYSSLSANYKKALDNTAAAWAASMAINHDMSGYTSRQEALTMLNVLFAIYDQNLRFLQKADHRNFLIEGES